MMHTANPDLWCILSTPIPDPHSQPLSMMHNVNPDLWCILSTLIADPHSHSQPQSMMHTVNPNPWSTFSGNSDPPVPIPIHRPNLSGPISLYVDISTHYFIQKAEIRCILIGAFMIEHGYKKPICTRHHYQTVPDISLNPLTSRLVMSMLCEYRIQTEVSNLTHLLVVQHLRFSWFGLLSWSFFEESSFPL